MPLPLTAAGSGAPGSGVLTPPTLAPVLIVTADLGSEIAELQWTASNKTASPGFGYRIYHQYNGGGYAELTTSTSLSYSDDQTGFTGNHDYYITPYNDAGEGAVSNDASITLPGEGEAPILSGPSSVFAEPFTLSWTTVPGATSYDLERSTDNISFGLLVNTALLSYETNESSQGFYYFRVQPRAGVVEGTLSNTVTVEYVVPLPWILETGFWDDGGEWKDTSNWND